MENNQAINDIIKILEHHNEFWGSGAYGWAPPNAAIVLENSRLDRQVSLAQNLYRWIETPDAPEHDGSLILAWANLGALVEGTMKWFLCVYRQDYIGDLTAPKYKDSIIEPDILYFYRLIDFFDNAIWENGKYRNWRTFVDDIRLKRNAIHSYQDREIGTFEDFCQAILNYRKFLIDLERSVPYPEEHYAYPFDVWNIIHE